MLSLSTFSFERLTEKHSFNLFDCGDPDINDFLKDDAINFCNSLLAVSYGFINPDTKDLVAYFCISNDSLIDKGDRSIWNKLNRGINNSKRRKEYPSVKIGRLGVSVNYQGENIGDQILDFIKGWFAFDNKTGCRFILVDAYNKPKVISFYQRNEFNFLTKSDEGQETRIMFFDLVRLL